MPEEAIRMSILPAELSTGMVHGRFIVAVIDGDDADQEPEVIPATGRIVFKASVGYIPVPSTNEGPVTVMKGPITGVLDSEGYLSTPHPTTGEPMYRGVKLLATDDPDMAVTDWTWAADYRFESVNGVTLQIPAHNFALPGGTVVDLTTMVKVPSSPGYGLPQAEAAALRAEAAAQVALDVKAMADAGEFDGAQGLPGNATMRIDTTAGTRVFISDGVTEKMVHGDTGWRSVGGVWTLPAWNASNGYMVLRRVDSTVFLEARLEYAGGTLSRNQLSQIINTPSPGWNPRSSWSVNEVAKRLQNIGAATPQAVGLIHSIGGLYVTFPGDSVSWEVGDCIVFSASWPTTSTWPTTLPGIPV